MRWAGPPRFRRVAVRAASLPPRALGGSAEDSPRCCTCRLAAASGGSAEVSPGRCPCRLSASRAGRRNRAEAPLEYLQERCYRVDCDGGGDDDDVDDVDADDDDVDLW